VWELRDERVVRWDIYRDRNEALAEVGLAPRPPR
jgi:hypothetical protein